MAASHINSFPVKQRAKSKTKIVDGHAHYTLKANHRLPAVGMRHKKAPAKPRLKRTSLNYMLNDWLVTFTHLGIAAASASITTVGWTHILFNTQQGIIITATLLEWIFDGAKRPACHQRNATSVANYIIFTIHIHVLFPFPMRLSSTEKVV